MKRVLICIGVMLAVRSAFAHQPTISDGSASSPESAIAFDDIQLSRVVYHEVTDTSQQAWLTFDIDEPQSLFITLGVPLIDRLEAYRPAFAVLGSGLPDVDLPFAIPDGVGGLLFASGSVSDPEVFDEPFSGTSSWILIEQDVDLPEAGTYYIVAYAPSEKNGKLWIAPGVREEFTLGDILELWDILPQVRAFHEAERGGLPCFLFPVAAVATVVPLIRRTRTRCR